MSERRYPEAVDVAIVGSGPAGATYARILSEQAPGASIAMFEVGPTVTNPPGAHVKNIADPAERASAQTRSEGPHAQESADRTGGIVKTTQRRARPGTFLLESGYQVEGEDGLPVAAMSSNVGGMAAHWTGACPRPNDSERIAILDADGSFDELLSEARAAAGRDDRRVRQLALRATSSATRLAAAEDAGRIATTRVQRMPLAVHRRDDGNLVWSGSDVVFGDVTRANPRFTLFDESLVTRVLVEDGRAAGVVVTDRRTGESAEVRAQFVVVAADALRTPQLLWASGIRPDALGRYLNDQAQIVFAVRIRDLAPTDDGDGAARHRSERVQRCDVGALHRRHALPRPGDAAGRLAREARGGRPGRARLHRGPRPVLREGPAGLGPRRVLRRTTWTDTGCRR